MILTNLFLAPLFGSLGGWAIFKWFFFLKPYSLRYAYEQSINKPSKSNSEIYNQTDNNNKLDVQILK